MSVKLNKTAMIDEYINNNITELINSNKSLEELCKDFNETSDKKVSFSSFYNRFKTLTKDNGLTKQRAKRTNKQDTKELPLVSPEEAKQLLEDLNEENKETLIDKIESINNNNIHIYDIDRYLNDYKMQTFMFPKKKPTDTADIIVDVSQQITINKEIYAPALCIMYNGKLYTNEEYNRAYKTEHKNKDKTYINIVKIKNINLTNKYYVCRVINDFKLIFKPFSETKYSRMTDILNLIKYNKDNDVYEKILTEEEAIEMLDTDEI